MARKPSKQAPKVRTPEEHKSFSERSRKGWETRRLLKEAGFKNMEHAKMAGFETKQEVAKSVYGKNIVEASEFLEAGVSIIENLKQTGIAREVESESDFMEERSLKDAVQRQQENVMYFNEIDMVYNNIQDLINQYPTRGSESLAKSLASEIRRYGRDKVVRAMENAPAELIGLAQDIVWYEKDSDVLHRAIDKFFTIIKGAMPSTEEAKMLGEVADQMGYNSDNT